MDVLARLALPGILALSATAALIVGILLVRYGFAAPEDDAYDAERRITATRIGHMLVVVCLAGIAVLASAALMARPSSPAGTPAAALGPSRPANPPSPAAPPDTPEPGDPARAAASADQSDGPGPRQSVETVTPSERPGSSETDRTAPPGARAPRQDVAARSRQVAAASPAAPEPTAPRQAGASASRSDTPDAARPGQAAAAARPDTPETTPPRRAGGSTVRPDTSDASRSRQAAARPGAPESDAAGRGGAQTVRVEPTEAGKLGKETIPARQTTADAADAPTIRRDEKPPAQQARSERQDTATSPQLPPRPRADERPPDLPPRTDYTWRSETGSVAATTGEGAPPPVPAGKLQLSTIVQGVHVDVHQQTGDAGDVVYTVHLAEAGNKPLTGADVSLLGRDPNGQPLRAALAPAGEPGYYRARVTARSAEDLRLRVVHTGARFEVSLDHAASW